jgi:hydrogenase maturation factor
MSRLHQVVGEAGEGSVVARDLYGREHEVSLLAYDGPSLVAGDWVVAQSGYALERADPVEAAVAMEELQTLRAEGGP